MKEITGNLWDYYDEGKWICITTNGCLDTSNKAIMGKGCALEAAKKFPKLPELLGHWLDKADNNFPVAFPDLRIITFPVKNDWKDDADLKLIEQSAKLINLIINLWNKDFKDDKASLKIDKIYIPRPGCGAGNLNWNDVKKVLEPIFDDRFIIITFGEES